MSSIQKWLTDVLKDVLTDGWDIRPYPFIPDGSEPGQRYVAVYRTLTEPAPNSQGSRQHTLNIVVMSGQQEPEAADEVLAASLDDVLDVIDTDPDLQGLIWTSCTRAVQAETYPSMTVEVTAYTKTDQES